jgi:hypothetical protein
MRVWSMAFVLAACGGGPALRNAPKPDPAVVAGAAAAIAGAATLADPNGAARRAEANKVENEKKPKQVKETVPGDVLDRAESQHEAQQQLVPDR